MPHGRADEVNTGLGAGAELSAKNPADLMLCWSTRPVSTSTTFPAWNVARRRSSTPLAASCGVAWKSPPLSYCSSSPGGRRLLIPAPGVPEVTVARAPAKPWANAAIAPASIPTPDASAAMRESPHQRLGRQVAGQQALPARAPTVVR
ncbi:MAG: hypothetical protein QOE61_199 [Micromonosporaceae bacterium]|nr:hypothetical protein [Micromonosporaceae bacterium]